MPAHLSKTTVPLTCARCGTVFDRSVSAIRPSNKTVFCSRDCRFAPRPLIPHPDDPDAMLVPLSRGLFATIDKADADVVSRYNWYAINPDGHGWYANRNTSDGGAEFLHRLIAGAEPGELIDHKDRDTLNCRRGNLRRATPRESNANQRIDRTNNTSGYRGVCRHRTRWVARVADQHIGLYDSAEDAARAYDAAAIALFGEFAVVNFPNHD